MPILTPCPECGKPYQFPEEMRGRKVRCPMCFATFLVGGAAADGEAPAGSPAEEEVPEVLPAGPDGPRGDDRLQSRPGPVARPRPAAPVERNGGRPAPAKSSTGVLLLVGGLVVGFLMLLCAGGAGLGWFFWSRAREAAAAQEKAAAQRAARAQPWAPPRAWPNANNGLQDGVPPKPQEDERRPPLAHDGNGLQGGVPPKPQGPMGPAGGPPAPPPRPRFDPPPPLRPVVPVEVKPADLKEAKVVKQLPDTASDVAVGGNGRFLLFWLPAERQLAVFDVSAARVVKSLGFTENVKFAAGMDQLLVALPRAGRVERYSLTTFEREAQAPLPAKGEVTALCMGYASNGPLWVQTNDAVAGPALFLDPSTLKEWKPDWGEKRMPADAAYLRASGDGRTFGMRNGVGGEPHTVTCVRVRDGQAENQPEWGVGSSVLVPSADGRYFGSGVAFFNSQLKAVYPREALKRFDKAFLPAVGNNDYFVELVPAAPGQHGGTVSFFQTGKDRPFAQLTGVEGVTNEQIAYGNNRDKLVWDQRVFFIPAAKVVVTVPPPNDQLVLHRFDVEAELERAGLGRPR
jgi:hypothetical protein